MATNFVGQTFANLQGQLGQAVASRDAKAQEQARREDLLARQGVMDARYRTEQDWKKKQQTEQERAWKQEEIDRKKKLAVEEAIRGIDLNYSPSADKRIVGVTDYLDNLSDSEFDSIVGKVGGSKSERAQHKLFTEKINKAYESVGAQDKSEAKKEMYDAYIRAGASRTEANAGADMKTAGMLSNAEKQANVQAQYDREYKDKKWLYEQQVSAAKDYNTRINKTEVAKIKAKGKAYSSSGYSGGNNPKATKDISDFLSSKLIEGDEVTSVNALITNARSKGYTDNQIAAILPRTVEEGTSFFGLFNLDDPEISSQLFNKTLAASFDNSKKTKWKGSKGSEYVDIISAEVPERRIAKADDQNTSAEVLADFKNSLALAGATPTVPNKVSPPPPPNTKKDNTSAGNSKSYGTAKELSEAFLNRGKLLGSSTTKSLTEQDRIMYEAYNGIPKLPTESELINKKVQARSNDFLESISSIGKTPKLDRLGKFLKEPDTLRGPKSALKSLMESVKDNPITRFGTEYSFSPKGWTNPKAVPEPKSGDTYTEDEVSDMVESYSPGLLLEIYRSGKLSPRDRTTVGIALGKVPNLSQYKRP